MSSPFSRVQIHVHPVATRRPLRRRAQHGFAILSAVFLLVVLALLAGMIVTLSSMQQVGQTRDLLGSRALYTARAGIEIGIFNALRNSSCPASSTVTGLAGATTGFQLVVTCSKSSAIDEGTGSSVYVYTIVSTASQGTLGGLDYVERQLQAAVTGP